MKRAGVYETIARGERAIAMRGNTMRERGSVWTFLLTMFMAVAATVAILPGCVDDDGGQSSSSESSSSD